MTGIRISQVLISTQVIGAAAVADEISEACSEEQSAAQCADKFGLFIFSKRFEKRRPGARRTRGVWVRLMESREWGFSLPSIGERSRVCIVQALDRTFFA